jgi:hypothetical protein
MNFKMEDVVKCRTKQDAAKVLDRYASDILSDPDLDCRTPEEAKQRALNNIGYLSGYYDLETKHRILELFDTEHPVFGHADPTPEEAFNAGRRLGEASKTGEDLLTVQNEIKRNLGG